MERRDFLKLIGVTGAGAATACDAKVGPQSLIPYVVPPENITPGIPTWYASTCRECPAGCGTHVKTREGRVIKLEGNPDSPVNRGKLCARGQAAHQNLYDPDRIKGPKRLADGDYADASWEQATAALAAELGRLRGEAGGEPGSVVLLTGLQTGTRERLYDEWAQAIGARRIVYEPFAYEPLVAANRRVFGEPVLPSYDIEGAEFVISFGADFLETWISPIRYAVEWGRMHAFRGDEAVEKGIFVAVEPRLSMTASNADEWVSVRPGTEYLVALAMANVLGAGGEASEWTAERAGEVTGVEPATIERLARLFGEKRSVALPGGISTFHPRATAAAVAVNLLNQAGGAVGDTVQLSTPVVGAVEGSYQAMVDLVTDMKTGRIQALLMAETNPVFSLPPGLGFAEALRQVPLRVSFSPVFDETAAWCHWLLPDHTPLESWGDWVPQQGVVGIQQPAMRPVFDTRATPDVLLDAWRAIGPGEGGAAAPEGTWYDYLRAAWSDRAADERAWAEVLKRGGIWEGAAVTPTSGQPLGGANAGQAGAGAAAGEAGDEALDFAPFAYEGPADEGTFELLVFPQIAMYDGRMANRPWLQELPDPATTVAWQTWAELHPETAAELGLVDGDVIAIESAHGSVEAPVIRYPGARRDTVALPLGRGHDRMGRYASGHGVNPIALLPPTADPESGGFAWQGVGVKLTGTGVRVPPLKYQGSDTDHGRQLAEAVPMAMALELASGRAKPHAEEHHLSEDLPLTVERVARDSDVESPYRWGMAISLDACTGCNACVTACSAENNLPFVGPERVAKSRFMTWIRIERYFEEQPGGALQVHHLPMLCQHCGAAPCEPVCPVYATYHNPDGLNVQVYNRCVGTRYCSNNCPYKVRYFNWFQYEWPEPLNWGLNPDVVEREKGVMEKCTYCVQRINAAKIAIKDQGSDAVIPEGMFQTACQQTCPTDAIVFGNLKDPESRVARLARGPLAYSALAELNTRPANFYLKQVTNRTGGHE